MIFVSHEEETGSEKRDEDGGTKKCSVSFQDQQCNPIEVGISLPAWAFEGQGSECSKSAQDKNLGYSFYPNFYGLGLLKNVPQF